MNDLFPLFVGISGKIIDELIDNNISSNPIYLDVLKSIHISLFTLTAKNDFLFSFSTLILSLFGAGVDTNFWKSFIALSFIFSILYLSPVDNWSLFIFILLLITYFTHIEEKTFQEEYSIKKLLFRVLALIFFTGIYLLPFIVKKYNFIIITTNINYIRKLILIAIGGLIISIMYQIYFLFIVNQA